MSRRRFLTLRGRPAALGLAAACLAATALAPAGLLPLAAAQATISGQARNAADSPDARQEISAFIDAQVARLASGDPAAVGPAREALIDQVRVPGTPSAFLNAYAELLSGRLDAALDAAPPSPDDEAADAKNALVRLNAAVVTQKVAGYTQSERLADLVTRLVGDPAPQVALWGVKAAGPLLPQVLDNALAAQRDKVVPAIVSAAGRFPANGPLAEDVYDALRLQIGPGGTPPGQLAIDNGVPVVLPAVLEVMGLRSKLYDAGGATPPEPLAEQRALIFVTYPAVWQLQGTEQKRRTVAALRDLMNAATAAAAAEPPPASRKDLATLLARVGSALQTIGTASGAGDAGAGVARASQALARISPSTPNDDLKRAVAGVNEALQSAYPGLPAVTPVAANSN